MSQTATLENIFFTPIDAIITADYMAARRTAEFISEYGFSKEPVHSGEPQPEPKDTNIIGDLKKTTFRYTQTGANGEIETKAMSIPTLSLIPLPLLHVDNADFDFCVRIIDSVNDLTKQIDENSPDLIKKNIIATLAPQKGKNSPSNPNSPHLDANINVKVKVVQADMPAGLSNLLAMMGANAQNISTAEICPQDKTVKVEIGKGNDSFLQLKDPLTNQGVANELVTVYYDESTGLSLSNDKKHWGSGLSVVTNEQGGIPWVASIKNKGQVKHGSSQKVTFTHSNGSTVSVDIYYYVK
ncbi:DUF2589 domain-containing protein [Fibrobacter sp. UWR2]|uniref:DUF2589 domain-containing protein n=1 Tax=Fibrobacter sp. UWR2 TaxID=1964352 RepID=UPI000B51EC32|nr:DUF2589 domain-containing protein [Fibrobacter sp. UWR2]OWV01800.1 hypothetical protein B7994_00790 [Fibrobacter sp. UWR2]